MVSLQGQLLIATPSLTDPNFEKTVVLVALHGEDGALGLILNRPIRSEVKELWSQVSKTFCVRDGFAREAGPVSGSLITLHDRRSLANFVVTDAIYVGTEMSSMESLVASDEGQAIFFLGHAGWGPGQLERELQEGSWLLLPARSEHVFGVPDPLVLWKDATREAGRRQIHTMIDLKHIPENPQVN